MNRLEVLTSIKSDPIYAKIPFIINTGHSDELRSKMAQDLGAEAYLAKTIPLDELLSTIAHFLSAQAT
jgi:CheY-like chemotaxis protein